jgi:polygalacturonase
VTLFLLIAVALGLSAQDLRQVSEPKIPPVCATLSGSGLNDTALDTPIIQKALDSCAKGQAVRLRGVFVSGPLTLRAGVTLLVDEGAVLYGSRNPRHYDLSPGSCGTVDEAGHGCKPLIGGTEARDAAIMGDGTIDGRGGEKLIGANVSWWDLAQEAKARNLNQNVPRLIQLSGSDNFTLYRIHLRNSANFHVSYSGGSGFTVWGIVIDTPKTARNTDGIDPANATNVTIAHSFIHVGDDNIAVKADARGPSSHMSIFDNHFYNGHGMSIGSETDGGVSAIRVSDLTIDGADNGLRIKSNVSRGGLVKDVEYSNICIRDTKYPVFMDTHYTPIGKATDKIPQFEDIRLRDVRITGAGRIRLDGFDEAHPLKIRFDSVSIDKQVSIEINSAHVQWGSAKSSTISCEERFIPLPAPGRIH